MNPTNKTNCHGQPQVNNVGEGITPQQEINFFTSLLGNIVTPPTHTPPPLTGRVSKLSPQFIEKSKLPKETFDLIETYLCIDLNALFGNKSLLKELKDEMEAMRALKGLPCLLEAKALMTHKDPKSHKKISTIVTPIYSGALQDIFDKKIKLSFKQKLKIAHDIMQGIAVMQAKGYVHRDLGARNYFYLATLSKKKITDISAIVADMGRTIPASDAAKKPVQGNSSYIAPEAFFRSKMKGNHYY